MFMHDFTWEFSNTLTLELRHTCMIMNEHARNTCHRDYRTNQGELCTSMMIKSVQSKSIVEIFIKE